MNADRLLALFERIAEAFDAVPRLRRLVLDLAVRGKLVAQDPNDEPASELLKRIAAEKARLVKAGEIRKKAAQNPKMVEPPHELPVNWRWVSLGTAFLYDAGAKREPKLLAPSLWLLELEDIEKETGRLLARTCVADRESKSTKSEFHVGDILYGKLRPYLTKVLVADAPGYSTTEIVAIRPFLPLCSEYCALALMRPDFVDYVTRLGQGTKMPRLRTEDAVVSPFPLPPLAEQRRIVAKVGELMALLDRLEAARTAREAARDRLTAASLARLAASAADAADFPDNARFALDALPALTTRPDQIKPLRQTILNLAVRGKLVEQDPNDEPASELLKQIAKARKELAAQEGIRKKKPVEPLADENELDLPANWVADAFANLIDPRATISYGVLVPGPDLEEGIPFVRAQDLMLADHPEKPSKTIAPEVEAKFARTRLSGGEILLCVVGSIGKLGVAPQHWAGANIARAVARIAPVDLLDRDYLLLFLRSDRAQRYFEEATRTLAQPTLNVGLIEKLPVPLPPLAEQHRIVARVDALVALCDRLEAALASADITRARLLKAVLHEALNNDAIPTMEAAQ